LTAIASFGLIGYGESLIYDEIGKDYMEHLDAQDPFLLDTFGHNGQAICEITDYIEWNIWQGTLDPCN
jgi:hypothetical protein